MGENLQIPSLASLRDWFPSCAMGWGHGLPPWAGTPFILPAAASCLIHTQVKQKIKLLHPSLSLEINRKGGESSAVQGTKSYLPQSYNVRWTINVRTLTLSSQQAGICGNFSRHESFTDFNPWLKKEESFKTSRTCLLKEIDKGKIKNLYISITSLLGNKYGALSYSSAPHKIQNAKFPPWNILAQTTILHYLFRNPVGLHWIKASIFILVVEIRINFMHNWQRRRNFLDIERAKDFMRLHMYLWLFKVLVIIEEPLRRGILYFNLHKDNKNSLRSNFFPYKKWEHSTLVAQTSVT